MSTRPPSLLLASSLTLVVALGALLFGAFLAAIAAGAVALLTGPVHGFVWVIAFAAVVYGVMSVVAAAGLWAGRAWAWPLAASIHLIALIGVLVAGSTGGFGIHIAAGVALATGGLATLAPTGTREALWR